MTQAAGQYIQRIQREQQKVEQKLAMLRRLWKFADRLHFDRQFMRDFEKLLGRYSQPLHDERDHLRMMMDAAERGSEVSANRSWVTRGDDEGLRAI